VGKPEVAVGNRRRLAPFRRAKVLGRDQGLIGSQQMQGDLAEVQPVKPFPALVAQAKVQVKAVNVGDNTFHPSLSEKGTPTLAGGRRPGDAISGGVTTIVYHILEKSQIHVKNTQQ